MQNNKWPVNLGGSVHVLGWNSHWAAIHLGNVTVIADVEAFWSSCKQRRNLHSAVDWHVNIDPQTWAKIKFPTQENKIYLQHGHFFHYLFEGTRFFLLFLVMQRNFLGKFSWVRHIGRVRRACVVRIERSIWSQGVAILTNQRPVMPSTATFLIAENANC